MQRKRLIESTLAFAVAAIALTWLAYSFGTVLLDHLLPIFLYELNWLMPTFHIDSLDWKIVRGETVVELTTTLTEHHVILNKVFPVGMSINVSTLAAHAWAHPVLMFALVFAWPGISWQRKPLLILTALPFVLIAELLDIPLMLWGALEDYLFWLADPARASESLGSWVQHFLDGGGRYALDIVLTLLAITLFKRFFYSHSAPITI